jgi:hypothetical protein
MQDSNIADVNDASRVRPEAAQDGSVSDLEDSIDGASVVMSSLTEQSGYADGHMRPSTERESHEAPAGIHDPSYVLHDLVQIDTKRIHSHSPINTPAVILHVLTMSCLHFISPRRTQNIRGPAKRTSSFQGCSPGCDYAGRAKSFPKCRPGLPFKCSCQLR